LKKECCYRQTTKILKFHLNTKSKTNVKTDSIFYRLFKTFPRIFFELIGQPNIDINTYQFVSVEIKQTAFRIDGVFIPVPNTNAETVYFTEVQFQPDTTFYRRLFSEIFLYLRQNETVNLWCAVVVYPTRRIETADTIPYQSLLSTPQVQRIYLPSTTHLFR
jgi:predicted transposase/invertase (TIGR01784 family)